MLKYHFNCYDKGKKAKEKLHYRQLAKKKILVN